MDSFSRLFERLKADKSIDGALVAIENSIAGSILPNYQHIYQSGLHITAEVYLRIEHNLLGLRGSSVEQLKEVYSHPMALYQCERFFEDHPHIKLIESEDTALSASRLKEIKSLSCGAIASELCAELYDLEILCPGIQTVKNNYTRFLMLERESSYSENATKASLRFRLENEIGALYKALEIVSSSGFNISKIQSVPEVLNEWRYYFHLDLLFETRRQFEQMLSDLAKVTQDLQVFGIYTPGKTL